MRHCESHPVTAHDPPAVASVGAEAVEAGAAAFMVEARKWPVDHEASRFGGVVRPMGATEHEVARAVLAAALPHLRAQVLAEVDAALRDEAETWRAEGNDDRADRYELAAAFLRMRFERDTLAGDGGEA